MKRFPAPGHGPATPPSSADGAGAPALGRGGSPSTWDRAQQDIRAHRRRRARVGPHSTVIRSNAPTSSHPAELAWEADLAARLTGRTEEGREKTATHDQELAGLDAEAILRSIDLRTIDLSPRRPGAGLEHGRTDKALGLLRQLDGPDIPLPPLPGRGFDAEPDLGP
jgi:hypothetical protein